MVKHKHELKTSSKRKPEFEFTSYILPGYFVPRTIQTTVQTDSSGEPSYVISGDLADEAEGGYWPELPHLAFANLRADDPRSAEAFIKKYGPLEERRDVINLNAELSRIQQHPHFILKSADVQDYQNELRAAWENDSVFVVLMEGRVVEGMAVDVLIDSTGGVQLRARSLLAVIAFLFLKDHRTEKLGICANPTCAAPYFRKKRSTQKYCVAGPCVDYAHRQHALRYWNTEGKKKRQQTQSKRQNERKNP